MSWRATASTASLANSRFSCDIVRRVSRLSLLAGDQWLSGRLCALFLFALSNSGLRAEAELGKRIFPVQVGDRLDHLAVVEVKKGRSFCRHLVELQSARLAPATPAVEHKD